MRGNKDYNYYIFSIVLQSLFHKYGVEHIEL